VFVFVYLVFIAPTEHSRHGWVPDAVAFTVYALAALGLEAWWSIRSWDRALGWLAEHRPPSPAEQTATLRLPLREAAESFVAWAVASVVFPAFGLVVDGLGGQAIRTGLTIFDGGLVSCAVVFLLFERTLRPVFAQAQASGPPTGCRGKRTARAPNIGNVGVSRALVYENLGSRRTDSWSPSSVSAVAIPRRKLHSVGRVRRSRGPRNEGQGGVVMQKVWLGVVVLGLSSAVGVAHADRGGTSLPFRVHGSGTALLAGSVSGTAQGTHIGNGTFRGSFVVLGPIPPCSAGTGGPINGTDTLIAANGDTVTMSFSARTCVSGPTSSHSTGTLTITGGTGRFRDATGSGATTVDADFSSGFANPGTITFSDDATISFNH
jgi:hypothetical protein